MTPAAFAGRDAAATVEHHGGETMGTHWSLHAVAAGLDVRAIAERAFANVIAQMSQWNAASQLSQFHEAPAEEWFPIAPEFAQVMRAALDIQKLSGGAFHPALGQLSEAWGFGAAPLSPAFHPDRARAIVPADAIELDAIHPAIRRKPGIFLDLSGIAKGFAIDLVAERLLAASVRHFLIEIGGELRGEGMEPSGQPWWVDVEMPPTSAVPPYRLALHDLSIATSGNYRRGVTINNIYHSHSFDPRTGAPICHGVTSVSVIHRSCMMADGWATALTVMGRNEALAVAETQQLAICMVEGDRETISSKWLEMLD